MKRRVLVLAWAGLGLAALSGPAALMFGAQRSQAEFGDSATFGVNRLSSATVDIGSGDRGASLDATTVAPGDVLVGQIEISNSGTLPLRYALASEFTGDALDEWITWTIWTQGPSASCDSAPSNAAMLFTGSIGPRADAVTVFGDPAVGLDRGDRVLPSSASEVLCVSAALSLDAPDSVQDTSFTQEFFALAEQHTVES